MLYSIGYTKKAQNETLYADTTETICGSTLTDPRFESTITSVGPVELRFVTDASNNNGGIRLSYEIISADPCLQNPCLNSGTCQPSEPGFECTCSPGWSGDICQTDIDECSWVDPCNSNGICTNTDGGFQCL